MNIDTPCIMALRVNSQGYATAGGGHRGVWSRVHGPIPPGLDIDHECHNQDLSCPGGPCKHRGCLNPDHLIARTRSENLRAGRTFSPEVTTRRFESWKIAPEVLERMKTDGKEHAERGWDLEDRSPKYCTCDRGPFKGNRALAIHRAKMGCL